MYVNVLQLECLHPFVELKMFSPSVKSTTKLPRSLNHGAKPSVTTRNDAFQQRSLRVMNLDLDPIATAELPQHSLLCFDRFDVLLRTPLEGSMGLGNKIRRRTRDFDRLVKFLET